LTNWPIDGREIGGILAFQREFYLASFWLQRPLSTLAAKVSIFDYPILSGSLEHRSERFKKTGSDFSF
jgi:hypothetical protein